MNAEMANYAPLSFNTTIFNNAKEIQSHVDTYIHGLHQEAEHLKQSKKELSDQSFKSGLLTYVPLGGKSDTHLLLLGGMGPLAGAHGMKECLSFLQDAYSVTLFQACFIPKRDSDHDVAWSLYEALHVAVQNCPKNKKIELIVVCNGAHHFIEDALKLFYQKSSHKNRDIRFHSLKASVEKKSRTFGRLKCIALQSNFAAQKGIYGNSQNIYSMDTIPPLSSYQKNLTLAIEGVKRFDKHTTLLNAIKVFHALMDYGAKRLLLGCAEIPIIIDSLKKEAPHDIQEYLSSVTLIDPLMLALQEMAEK
ncbi:aspartate/glutamate racemase family protein [Sulfurospirillum oryzae]|uniref:aspartate/glutamate racemase family protein n=1 Tax=Sulfurospirillum oryzae TaxID=2976535 RepID=UPI0021E71C5F|nr:aspartate/glutamate racemase family protein [Sulfurospirillum oryzae]